MSVQAFVKNLVHDVQLAFRRFSYDMQTNPRTFLLGYAVPALLVGAAVAAGTGAATAGAAAAKKTKNPKKIAAAAGKGAIDGLVGG